MHIALFILYFVLFSFAITRSAFFTRYIKSNYVVILFALHVIIGCFHTWIAYKFYPNHGDIWSYFEASVKLKEQFIQSPIKFLKDFFSSDNFNVTDRRLPILNIQYQILAYLNILLNFISFDNFYVNTLIFSFPVFAGTMALFNVFYETYKKPLPAFFTLLLPSVLFWTSELFKDGPLYAAIGYFLYIFLKPETLNNKKLLQLASCCLVIFISRTNTLLTFLPAVFFLFLTEKKMFSRRKSTLIVLSITTFFILLSNLLLSEGLLYHISERQKDFQSLTGGSRMYLPVLEPSIKSFLSVFPIAIFNGFFQPLPGSGGKLIYTAFAIEQFAIWLIVLLGAYKMAKKKISLSNFEITCLLFVLPGLVICGYIVPFAGAIIRYRSIYLPFLAIPFINIVFSGSTGEGINLWFNDHIMSPLKK